MSQAPGRRATDHEALFWREHHDRVPATPVLRDSPAAAARIAALRDAVKRAFAEFLRESREIVNTRQLELVRSSYAEDEFNAALDVMMDDRMTMGAVTAAFEQAWADYVGDVGALMVNSGSSANLLALAALAAPELPNALRPGDEVIVPAVAWPTTIYPVIQMGAVPVFVDIDPETLNIDPARIADAIGPRTRGIVLVHLLGNPCDMEAIMTLADRHGLWVVEDCCEAMGARVNGRAVGTFGAFGTFSCFFSHHMTTVEGGLLCFHDRATWSDRVVSLRAHGWVRGRSDREAWKEAHPDIDDRWLFVSLGYNVRPTDINAAFGLAQLKKLPGFVANRQRVRRQLLEDLRATSPWLRFQLERPGHEHSAFGFSLIVDPGAPFSRADLQRYLEARGIQTRPIVGSNFARQPVMRHVAHRVSGALTNADVVHFHGLMFGNHPDVTASQIAYVKDVFEDFVATFRRGA